MNDADLSAALHRDAALAGEPAPDLLDQLQRRRTHQRHQRLGVAAAVLGVVVVAGGIPLGLSLTDRPDDGTAHTPPAATSSAATPSAAVPTAPVVTSPSSATSAPSGPAGALPAPPGCPDAAALLGLLPAPTNGDPQPTLGAPTATCSGDWAVIGVRYGVGQSVALFQFAQGSWRPADTGTACTGGSLPDDLVAGVCNAG